MSGSTLRFAKPATCSWRCWISNPPSLAAGGDPVRSAPPRVPSPAAPPLDQALALARSKGADEADLRIAAEHYQRLFVPDEAVLTAGARADYFEPDGKTAAPAIAERVRLALIDGTPLYLVRVGNGEGNAVSMLEQPVEEAVFQGFDFEFVSQNGAPIDVGEAVALSRLVVDAIKDADIQGYRIGHFDEDALIRGCLSKAELSPVFGLIHARALFAAQLGQAATNGTWFTSAWIHLDLIDHLDSLLECAPRVFVVTGRPELEGKFLDRLGPRLGGFMSVPVQGYVPRSRTDSHFGLFESFLARLQQEDLAGALVLVGAGLFGKVYCQAAKRKGAIAIDMGSAFDLLAGVATRPVHRPIPLANVRW